MSESVVYFDLDGVLADWVTAFEAHTGMSINEFNELERPARSALKSSFGYDFYRNLPVLESGMNLFVAVTAMYPNVVILSAHGDHNVEEVCRAKREWVAEHLGNFEVILVPKLEDKAAYAHANATLIDDRERAVESFIAAGGVAYLFDGSVG